MNKKVFKIIQNKLKVVPNHSINKKSKFKKLKNISKNNNPLKAKTNKLSHKPK
jgi:hypothetical protein